MSDATEPTATIHIDEDAARQIVTDMALDRVERENEAWKAFLAGYSYGYSDGSEPREEFDERSEFRERIDELFDGYYND